MPRGDRVRRSPGSRGRRRCPWRSVSPILAARGRGQESARSRCRGSRGSPCHRWRPARAPPPCADCEDSRRRVSCLSSTPTTKKKTARSPSAAHVARLRSRCTAAGPITTSEMVAYASCQGEFAQISARAAAEIISTPPTTSPEIQVTSRDHREGGAFWDTRNPSGYWSSADDRRRIRRPDFPALQPSAYRIDLV